MADPILTSALATTAAVAGALATYWKMKPSSNGNGQHKTPVPMKPCGHHEALGQKVASVEENVRDIQVRVARIEAQGSRIEGLIEGLTRRL